MDEQERKAAAENAPPEDSPVRKRPNAKYRLSKEKIDSDQLTFYYSREKRLAKAPQAVKNLYKEEPPPRFNLLRPLIGSKPRAMMFGSIVLICVTMLFLSVLGFTSGTHSFAGNNLSVEAKKIDGTVIVAVKKTIKKANLFSDTAAYTGAVDMAVSPAAGAASAQAFPVFYHRVFFTLESAEEYRFSVPFDSDELVMVLQTERNTLNLKLKAK